MRNALRNLGLIAALVATFAGCDDARQSPLAPEGPSLSTTAEAIGAKVDEMEGKVDAFHSSGAIDNGGIATGLKKLLSNARDAAQRDDRKTTENMMGAFQNRVRAQRGKHIDTTAADELEADAQEVAGLANGTIQPSRADLSVSLQASPDAVTVGEDLTYTVTVASAGPDAVTDVRASLWVLGDVQHSSASEVCTGDAAEGGLLYDCTIASLEAGADVVLEITVRPQTGGEQINGQADLTDWSGAEDPDLTNNIALHQTRVNSLPAVQITSPEDGSTFVAGETIVFSGSAVDAEDREITGDGLVWTSSADGEIGRGGSFTSDALSTGSHTITLQATDSHGAAGFASVAIQIEVQPASSLVQGEHFTGTIEAADEVDRYVYEATAGETVQFMARSAAGSTLEGTLTVLDPDDAIVGSLPFATTPTSLTVEVEQTGTYTMEVSATTGSGSYEASVTNGLFDIVLHSNTETTLGGKDETDRFAFHATGGTLVNIAYGSSDMEGRVVLALRDPSGTEILSTRSAPVLYGGRFHQTGIVELPSTGTYVVEVSAVDSGSHGTYTLGLAAIDSTPTPITPASPYLDLSGGIEILGDRHFYSFSGARGEVLNAAIHTPGALTANVRLRQPSSQPFYNRPVLGTGRTTNVSEASRHAEIGRQVLPEDGEYIIEVDGAATIPLDQKFGAFELRIFRPELIAAGIDTEITGQIDPLFELDRYGFDASPLVAVLIHTWHAVSGGYLYSRLYADPPLGLAMQALGGHW